MRKILLGLAATTVIATPLAATAANAYTIDSNGYGFVGKGEVQSAFGWKNADAQANQSKVTFSSVQPTKQSLSQDVSQVGTQSGSQTGTQAVTQSGSQAGTQVVSQDLTCTFTNGNGTKTFHREGVRDGERTGTREGTREGVRDGSRTGERDGVRTGSQAGKQVGSLVSALDAKDKVTGQYTGWFLKGFKGDATYAKVGAPIWAAPVFDDYVFDDYVFGDYSFGDAAFGDAAYDFGAYAWEPVTGTEWGEWENVVPGENPDDCLRSTTADKITQLSNVITPGLVTDGDITDGDITDGDITDGDITDGDITDGKITWIDPIHYGNVVNDGAAKVSATYTDAKGVATTKAL